MPEHVHLLVSEPEDGRLAAALQALKQLVAQQLGGGSQFWQPRYYDFNVWSRLKCKEKLRYLHHNPVKRGLVARPEDWKSTPERASRSGDPGMEQLSALAHGRSLHCRDRVSMDSTAARENGHAA